MSYYAYKVWSKDYMCFLDAMLAPVYRKKIKKRKWLYAFWGYYTDPASTEARCDKMMLERSGFKRVELVEVD